jgi:hypothetical protein
MRIIAEARCLIDGAPTCCICSARFFAQDFKHALDTGLPEGAEAPIRPSDIVLTIGLESGRFSYRRAGGLASGMARRDTQLAARQRGSPWRAFQLVPTERPMSERADIEFTGRPAGSRIPGNTGLRRRLNMHPSARRGNRSWRHARARSTALR